ncbi:MAG: sulfatase-like hydrolase/transferase [Bryobacteraceae bacterium]|jgi:arylsulfatase A-like enzyme
MTHDEGFNRREFLARLGAGALLGAAGLNNRPAQGASTPGAWTPPPVLKNPNILVIMVDQMRTPVWLNSTLSAQLSSVMPNIMGRIQSNSYNFDQFFVAATMCSASRAALLTGLYAPQTAMYINTGPGSAVPTLNPAFPTWGDALTVLNPAYQKENIWWFGKWHLSEPPLTQYGFNTRLYPSTPSNVSPDGSANEGTDGGPNANLVWANDSMIAGDFIGWLEGQPPTPAGQPSSPWCATVSLVNPHDIGWAPAWLQPPYPPTNVTMPAVYFPPPAGSQNPPAFYSAQPSPWNLENLTGSGSNQVTGKPTLQYSFLAGYLNPSCEAVTDWVLFLNQYFWLQSLVDYQVGRVLTALQNSAFANNTIVIFLSDHGDFAGSHGLHDKGGAVYDEALSVPFYVQFPGQTGSIAMNQMCSGVDLFGLICDLATGGSGQWRLAYPDQANRQSMWSFLYNNSSETRVAPSIGLPYIFHTFDQFVTIPGTTKVHIVCMRTKSSAGGKLALYSEWAPCTTYPDSTPPDVEFYNYSTNPTELLNDATNPSLQSTLQNYAAAMGTLGAQSTGLTASELNRPLIGTGTDGNPLSQAQAAAQMAYVNYASGTSACTGV